MIGLGLRAQKGGAVAVAVRVKDGAPELLRASWLDTHVEGDRRSLEPYGLAYETVRDGGSREAAAVAVAEGRAQQDRLATEGLRALLATFDGAVVAGLLVNRAGWIIDLLEHSLGWAEHAPVCDGLAVREALRIALRSEGIAIVEQDEKTLIESGAAQLALAPAGLEARLKALGASAKPWRKEQKLACLAGWLAAVTG